MASRNDSQKKFLENVQIDLRNLSQEAKKKYPQLKDVSMLKMSTCPGFMDCQLLVLFVNVPFICISE